MSLDLKEYSLKLTSKRMRRGIDDYKGCGELVGVALKKDCPGELKCSSGRCVARYIQREMIDHISINAFSTS
jgi:hypothetical protein